ncbi:hypothetical protein D3C87_2143260 [compost metagenome]
MLWLAISHLKMTIAIPVLRKHQQLTMANNRKSMTRQQMQTTRLAKPKRVSRKRMLKSSLQE